MAKVRLNPAFESIRGAIGELVYKQYGNKTVLSRKPHFENRVFSAAQLATQERFRHAMLMAKAALADVKVRSTYEQAARVKGKPIVSLMVADFFSMVQPIQVMPDSERRDKPGRVAVQMLEKRPSIAHVMRQIPVDLPSPQEHWWRDLVIPGMCESKPLYSGFNTSPLSCRKRRWEPGHNKRDELERQVRALCELT